jgi:hypothetical protein
MAEDAETRDRIVKLAFSGDEQRFDTFVKVLRDVAPEGAKVVLRGSAVTGARWKDGQPFDADGPGTSDLDVTFVCREMVDLWTEFHVPGLNTVPLSDEYPDACPPLKELRRQLCNLANRPVNLQASAGLAQLAREVLWDQPHFTLIDDERQADE